MQKDDERIKKLEENHKKFEENQNYLIEIERQRILEKEVKEALRKM
jgi:hypothetical protein